MERLIEVYRGDYWLPAFHLLMLVALVYGCVTIRKHTWPSIGVILSVLLEYAAFWGRTALIRAAQAGDPVTMYLHIANGLGLSAFAVLCVAIFGWRSRPRHKMGTPTNGSP